MTSLIDILSAHARRWPLMEPRDAVKLLYQSEFGGGHLIADPEQSLLRLREEAAVTPHDPHALLCEDIGCGMLRVHLAALDESICTLEQFNDAFVRSSALQRGSLSDFQAKLALLTEECEACGFAFSRSELSVYLAVYRESGYPMVSHSTRFHDTYRPAYRVLRWDCLPFSLDL